ncbi:MAG: ComEC/Rec2 family competence protein [Patescibacteria group bacterium]
MFNLKGKLNYRPVIRVLIICLALNILAIVYFSLFGFSDNEIAPQLEQLKVSFLDIGQGDAVLITLPDKRNILVDGGPDKNVIYKLDKYLPRQNRTIDLMILTHPDPDHLNGLVEALKRFSVSKIFYTGVSDPDPVYYEWQEIIKNKNIPLLVIDRAEEIKLDEKIFLVFLWPRESLSGKSLKDDNIGSLVFKLNFENISFLFTGDINKEVEEKLLNKEADLRADVLKIAHHGSKHSSTVKFLEKVKPSYAVISVGKNNKFGHPNLRVIFNLNKVHSQILRTDKNGDIIFTTDGKELNYKISK